MFGLRLFFLERYYRFYYWKKFGFYYDQNGMFLISLWLIVKGSIDSSVWLGFYCKQDFESLFDWTHLPPRFTTSKQDWILLVNVHKIFGVLLDIAMLELYLNVELVIHEIYIIKYNKLYIYQDIANTLPKYNIVSTIYKTIISIENKQ